MISFIARVLGNVIILALTAVGAMWVVGRVLTWKDGHDNLYKDTSPTVI